MSQQPTTEQRLALREQKVADLELQRAIQETRDIALSKITKRLARRWAVRSASR
ncbi:MAG TPA: hypothetical protein VGD98_25675 [Ktedonobacteraceae bacterium]